MRQTEPIWTCDRFGRDSSTLDPLLARLDASMTWATLTVRSARSESPIWCPEGNHGAIRPIDKMVLEASLLALVAGRYPGARNAAEELIQEVAKHTDVTLRIYELVRWRPHLRTSLGLLWVALDSFDCGNISQRRLMCELWEREPFPVQPHERSPYRLLDQAWVSSKARGVLHPAIESGVLLPFTSLGNLDGAPFMHSSDLYALTHAAMYMTDFGEWALPNVFASEVIGALSLSRLLDEDFDLAAELALADVLVGDATADEGQIVVRAVLNDVFDSLGYVPSPTYDQGECNLAADPETYIRFHSYHTTFVYALLCHGLLRKHEHGTAIWEPGFSTYKSRTLRFRGAVRSVQSNEHIGMQVAHKVEEWTDACRARGASYEQNGADFLRRTLDAHLVRAVQADAVDDMIQLLGMSEVGGQSRIDQLVRVHVTHRSRLARVAECDSALTDETAAAFDEEIP